MSGWTLETLLRGRADRVLLLVGPPLVLDLGTALATRAVLAGQRVLYLDGANAFDPYIPARMAREAGLDPRQVLGRLFISRAFTCHQFETMVVDRLEASLRRYRPGLVVISGWGHLFHDENVPPQEAMRLLESTARAVRRLAARGTPFLATHEDGPQTPRPRPLEACLARAATAVIRVDRAEGLVHLTPIKAARCRPSCWKILASPPGSAGPAARGMADERPPVPQHSRRRSLDFPTAALIGCGCPKEFEHGEA